MYIISCGRCVLTLPTRGISSWSGGVYTTSLLSRISRSKPNLLAPNQSPCDVRTSAFMCISFSCGSVAFWLCRHEELSYSGGVHTPSLLSRISRSKPNLLAPNQSPCDVRTLAFTCISLSRGLVAFWVCRHEESRHSPEVCTPRAYLHEYLAQNPTYSRQTKAHVMYEPRPLHVYRFHAARLCFGPADTRNSSYSDRCVHHESTFMNISLRIQPTCVKSNLI